MDVGALIGSSQLDGTWELRWTLVPGNWALQCNEAPIAILAILRSRGEVAQLVEHATENRGVGSSILPLATLKPSRESPARRRVTLGRSVW